MKYVIHVKCDVRYLRDGLQMISSLSHIHTFLHVLHHFITYMTPVISVPII